MHPMQITIVNQFYPPDEAPTGKLCKSLAQHFAAQGHHATVITSAGGYRTAGGDDHANDASDRIDVRRVWTPRMGKKSTLRRCADYACFYLGTVRRLLFMRRQDVVICLTTPPLIVWAALIHKLIHRRSRVALWNMDCYPEVAERSGKIREKGLVSRVLRWNNRAVFKRIDHLISLDHAMEDLTCSQYANAKRRPKTAVIPNWELAAAYPATTPPPAWEGIARLGLTGKFVALYAGNMGVGHTFDALLDAAQLLRDRDDFALLMVGNGAKRAEIESAVRERGLTNVMLHDYVERADLPAMLASASCAVITLHPWALGVMSPSKLHANLAMGLPVVYIGPAGSNVDEAIARFDCGGSFRADQNQEAAAFLTQLMEQPEQRDQMATQARAAFDQAYCDTHTLPQFDAALGTGPDTSL